VGRVALLGCEQPIGQGQLGRRRPVGASQSAQAGHGTRAGFAVQAGQDLAEEAQGLGARDGQRPLLGDLLDPLGAEVEGGGEVGGEEVLPQ
jgi:hypothetical protein